MPAALVRFGAAAAGPRWPASTATPVGCLSTRPCSRTTTSGTARASWRRAKTDYSWSVATRATTARMVRGQVGLRRSTPASTGGSSPRRTRRCSTDGSRSSRTSPSRSASTRGHLPGAGLRAPAAPRRSVARDHRVLPASFSERDAVPIFTRPLIIWSGTWKFSAGDRKATGPVRGSSTSWRREEHRRLQPHLVVGRRRGLLLVLGQPEDVPGLHREAQRSGKHGAERRGDLDRPGRGGLRRTQGRWLDRRRPAGGTTFLTEIDAAIASSPDAIGLISWNEYSENSHIEPSVRYGYRALDVVGERLGSGAIAATLPAAPKAESQALGAHRRATSGSPSGPTGPVVLAVFGALVASLVVVGVRRARRTPHLRVVGLDAAGEDSRSAIGPLTRSQIMAARRRARRMHLDRERHR